MKKLKTGVDKKIENVSFRMGIQPLETLCLREKTDMDVQWRISERRILFHSASRDSTRMKRLVCTITGFDIIIRRPDSIRSRTR